MLKKTFNRGFTLIELLVVIAIIGILASVVLASLNTARDKGTNAAIQQSVSNARSQAEIYGNQTDGSVDYDGLCDDANINQLESSIASKNGGNNPACFDDQDEWVFEAQLAGGAGYICVDHTGLSTTTGASVSGDGTDGSVDCGN